MQPRGGRRVAAVFEAFPDAHWAQVGILSRAIVVCRNARSLAPKNTQGRVEVTCYDLFTIRAGDAIKNLYGKNPPAIPIPRRLSHRDT